MSTFNCKMCGGALEIQSNATVATCDYCGTQQTLPKLADEKRANLYDRANHFRRNNDFDKAMAIYEQILNEDQTDAEAYWSLVLCQYGIEYVEDPLTCKRIPTVNRAQFTSIFDDDNYKSALQYADMYQRRIYEEEAKAINEIQKGILAISQNEEPFDVFICYKETDANGRRTQDSVLAQDLYYQLTQEGFKVFFARITLEDKLGSAYEPYIFAALNSAKVMVVLGTKPEHFSAVWVKNEWSRYLALVKNSKGKKMLIPAYRGMDPYDLPEEFSHLQAQDMSKLGFMQDLIRGIKKIVAKDTPAPVTVKEPVAVSTASGEVAPLLKRGYIYLEDKQWDKANEYFERVLDMDPECVNAYLGKLLAELHVPKQSELRNYAQPFDYNYNYSKVIRYGDQKLVSELQGYIHHIKDRNEQQHLAAERERLEEERRAEQQRLEGLYSKAKSLMSSGTFEHYRQAAATFATIKHYRDAASLWEECKVKIQEFETIEEKKRQQEERERKERAMRRESSQNWGPFLLCLFLGFLGIHKFKEGKKGLGILYIFTCGLFGIGWIVDTCKAIGKFYIKWHKILAIVIAVVFFLYMGVMLYALQGNNDYGLIYEQNADGTYTIIDVQDKESTNIVIPGTYLGKSVTCIGDSAFANCKYLETITISNSIISIGDSAFANCISLVEIVIPSSVTYIGVRAFKNCSNLRYATFKDTNDWFVTTTEDSPEGYSLTFSYETVYGTALTNDYVDYYWYKLTN